MTRARKYDTSDDTPRRSLQERDRLVLENQKLVWYTLLRMKKKGHLFGMSEEDASQEGMIALIQAATHYDETKGYRFSTYAVYSIHHRIYAKASADRLIRAPGYHFFGAANKNRGDSRSRAAYAPDVEKTAVVSRLPEAAKMIPEPDPEPRPFDDEDHDVLDQLLSRLDPRTRDILLRCADDERLCEVGALYGVSSERTRQIRNVGMAKVRLAWLEMTGEIKKLSQAEVDELQDRVTGKNIRGRRWSA